MISAVCLSVVLSVCFPIDLGGYGLRRYLPVGDLVGKGEPAQGSSNGLRTIHALDEMYLN